MTIEDHILVVHGTLGRLFGHALAKHRSTASSLEALNCPFCLASIPDTPPMHIEYTL